MKNSNISKTFFHFLPNGENVNILKNQAKKLKKSGKFSTISSALNFLSKENFGKSFNKSFDSEKSPYLLNNKLVLPFFHEGLKYISILSENELKLSSDYVISFPKGVTLGFLDYSKIEKLDKGFSIVLNTDESIHGDNRHYIDVTLTDEGISADLIILESFDGDSFEYMSLDSNYVFFNELTDISSDFDTLSSKYKDTISDFKASIYLNHTDADDSSLLFSYDNINVSINGYTSILDPNGSFLIGKDILSLIKNNVCSEKELFSWLENRSNNSALRNFVCLSSPQFEFTGTDKVSEPFSSINLSKNKLFNKIHDLILS